MLRVVLPITTLAAIHIVSIEIIVNISIEIVVVVDVDVSAIPIAIAPVAAPGTPSGRA